MKSLFTIVFLMLAGHITGQTLKAVNDTIDLIPGIPKTVYLLANDTIPAGDSIKITGGVNFTRSLVISTWKYKGWFTYVANQWGFNGQAEGSYTVNDVSVQKLSVARIIIRIRDHSYDSLAINNINACFNASGLNFILFFADPSAQRGFVVPKGSGKKTIFTNSLWIGGKDRDSNIYAAGDRYRQGYSFSPPGTKPDYYAGPVMDSANYSVSQDTLWNYIWNIKKTEIEYNRLHWQDAGYQPIHDILTWPGNGDVNLGEASQLAPYFDRSQDGVYNPMDGDYPLIRGDQALYFIFNENRGPHQETGGTRTMKAEFHAMAYGWDMPGDSAFNNTLFLNYKVYNRSQQTYFNTYLGMFSDIDIGSYVDDYVGCDVYRGSYYGYNGKPIDGNGESYAYGAHPPAQSVTILAGPKLETSGTDRPCVDGSGHQLCNESINGTGFGDGIPDNERMGLNGFIWTYNSNAGTPFYMNDPTNPHDYYNYLCNRWMDSTYMIYGGLGHAGFGGFGPQCRYLFPGASDTLNWGTGCVAPNGQKSWTELSVGNRPGDRRGLGSVGPFTFHPGEMKELDMAFVFARDYTSPDTLASVTKLVQMIDIVRHSFLTNTLPDGKSFTMVPGLSARQKSSCIIYPNPAVSLAHFVFNIPLAEPASLRLFDDWGKLVHSQMLNPGTTEFVLDVTDLSRGLYLAVIQSSRMLITKKMFVIR